MSVATVLLLVDWIRRDFRIRYIQTSLGTLWALLQPLSLTLIFVFVFRRIASIETPVPYASFVLPAMLLWSMFSTGVAAGINAMSTSMYIASKASYPRVVAPLSAALLPVVDLLVAGLVLPVVFLTQGTPVSVRPQWLVVGVLGCLLLSAGVGALFGALSVFVRDIRNVLPLALQLLLLLTPVAYPAERLPDVLRWSPLSSFVEAFRAGLLATPAPSLGRLALAFATSVGVLALGLWYFGRVEGRFADVA